MFFKHFKKEHLNIRRFALLKTCGKCGKRKVAITGKKESLF